jgi:hypothetical protein
VPNISKALVVLGQAADQLSQELEGLRVRVQALGRGRSDLALSTERGGVGEDIAAGRVRG